MGWEEEEGVGNGCATRGQIQDAEGGWWRQSFGWVLLWVLSMTSARCGQWLQAMLINLWLNCTYICEPLISGKEWPWAWGFMSASLLSSGHVLGALCCSSREEAGGSCLSSFLRSRPCWMAQRSLRWKFCLLDVSSKEGKWKQNFQYHS